MPTFSEQVQALCEAVFTAKCARASAVDEILASSRQRQQNVRDDQDAAAARLKADLAANCRERSEQVQAFRDRVRSEHRAAADRLRRTLQQNQQDRQQTVNSMLEGFDQAQRAFGEQCQAASRAWREMQERTVGSC